MRGHSSILLAILGAGTSVCVSAADVASAYQNLAPYTGPSVPGVDTQTLTGKVMCGYQGWFRTPNDGSASGWQHYQNRGSFKPGSCSIDLWPDVSEFSAEEKVPTAFTHADGSTAHVFSSLHPKTVNRHFAWMRDYGIDGAFVQRFATVTLPRRSNSQLTAENRKLVLCREAANRAGRSWALMYDLSSMTDADFPHLYEDWKMLRKQMRITDDPAYLHHAGRPLVAIWGVGFNDSKRSYSLEVVEGFVRFLRDNPEFGECSIMLGVPTGWRTGDRDAVDDPKLLEILSMAHVISPWTVGRYRDVQTVSRHADTVWRPDQTWCTERKKDYLPVVFPGFSWHNLHHGAEPLGSIPRDGGRFFLKQILEAKGAGARMLYVAMFDEIDEGTAIFKCTNTPPVGKSSFLSYEGLPSDHYLWLTGQAGRLIREELPQRNHRNPSQNGK